MGRVLLRQFRLPRIVAFSATLILAPFKELRGAIQVWTRFSMTNCCRIFTNTGGTLVQSDLLVLLQHFVDRHTHIRWHKIISVAFTFWTALSRTNSVRDTIEDRASFFGARNLLSLARTIEARVPQTEVSILR